MRMYRFIHKHPANAKALGVEVLADGAKRQRRKPTRLLEEGDTAVCSLSTSWKAV